MLERKATAKNLLFFLLTLLTLVFGYYILAISPANAQVPKPYVPCGSTKKPEFHSLRPYQSSPCDQSVSEVALFCGNSLVLSDRVSRTQTVAPNVASNCKPLGNSKYKCSFTFNKTTNIAIDLSEAELPILGNTQNVINSQSQEEGLTDADKLNEYVSWYLNGTTYRAEYPYLDTEDPQDVAKIVNFSGPLKKLLPRTTQMRARIATVKKAGEERHDQIVGCTYGIRIPLFGTVIGGIPADCYDDSFFSFPRVEHHLSEWKNRLPPLEEDIGTKYADFQEYWKAYQEWRGKFCFLIPIFGKEFLLCGQNPLKPDYIGNLFSYIPFSSTEDRKGQVSLSSSNVTPASPDVELTNVSLNVEPAELFFSHTEESVELAALLQQTFIPSEGVEETGPVLNVSPNEFCDLTNVRANPGDDLFAGEIAGVLSYTADFSCEMNAGDVGKACDKDVSIGLNVQTETPQADELWSRLVAGPAAVFKRIFPKVDSDGPVFGLLDIPAVTNVNYSADNLVSIGNPSTQRSGAELYFPHLGGIHEYFLKGIQTALRPKGFGEQILSGTTPEQAASSELGDICKIAKVYNIPCCQLAGVWAVESGQQTQLGGSCCRNGICGPMQIAGGRLPGLINGDPLKSCPQSNESCLCSTPGAWELAARMLLVTKCVAAGECSSFTWQPAFAEKYAIAPDEYTATGYYEGNAGGCVPSTFTQCRWGQDVSYCDAVESYCSSSQLPAEKCTPSYCSQIGISCSQ